MKRTLIFLVFLFLFLLVGFFAIGPALFADGSMQERLWTLAIVLVIYIILTYILIKLLKIK